MRTGDIGVAIIQAFEGCLKPAGDGTFKPYVCPAGVLTIGWGHTNHHEPKFSEADRWTQAKCDAVLRGDLGGFERHVAKLAPEVVLQHRFDALVSWAYNTGGPASSAVWKYAREGNVAETRLRLDRWNKGGGVVLNGLIRRRKAEGELFAGDIEAALRTAGARRPTASEPSARTDRDKPTIPPAEAAKRTKRELGTATAGSATGGGAAASKQTDAVTQAVIVFGIVLLVVGVILFVRKYRKANADWA
jgi:lysozyme